MFWLLGIVLLVHLFNWKIVLGLFCFRILLQWIAIGKSAHNLNSKDLIVLTPFLDIFLISFQLFIFSANLISKPKHWK